MRKIRVLIVDDSLVIRRLLNEILSSDPELEVVGSAATGAIALSKLPQLNPDVVTLDVEMPGKNGLETLVELRRTHPKLPVIMFSSLTEKAAVTTLDALGRGATDYVTKPSGAGSREAAMEHVRSQLLPKVRTLGGSISGAAVQSPPTPRVAFARTPPPTALAGRIDILAVGASTGGPNALAEVFGALPADFPVPIVIVQHMPPVFTKLFADRLSASCRLPFREVHDGDLLLPGHAYVAPGDYHMRVVSDGRVKRLALDHGAQENSCRPAVDVLFRSVAEHFGSKSLAVVMTGMGQDGLRGCERIHERGGQVIVQNEATSVVWGMPGFVARAGIADAVLPLVELAPEVLRRVRRGPRSIEETHHVA